MQRLLKSRRQTDAGGLSFPFQLVIVILAGAGAIWTSQYSLRSDVRDIRTVIEERAKADQIQRQLDQERLERAAEKQQAQNDALTNTIETLKREQQLFKIEFQQFKESMLTLQGRR